MNDIQIIQANVSHVSLLAELSIASFREAFEKDNNPDDFKKYMDEAFSLPQLKKDIEEPGSTFFIAYSNGEAAGYARLRNSDEVKAEFPNKKLLELHRLYILKKYIGKGIGKILMNQCITYAVQKGFEMLWLGVWEKNYRAQTFYKNFGFEKFSSHIFMIGSDAQTDYLLKKDLVNS